MTSLGGQTDLLKSPASLQLPALVQTWSNSGQSARIQHRRGTRTGEAAASVQSDERSLRSLYCGCPPRAGARRAPVEAVPQEKRPRMLSAAPLSASGMRIPSSANGGGSSVTFSGRRGVQTLAPKNKVSGKKERTAAHRVRKLKAPRATSKSE